MPTEEAGDDDDFIDTDLASSADLELRAILAGEEEVPDLIARSRALFPRMHADDREDAINLNEAMESAIAQGDPIALTEAIRAVKELLFFMEGKPN